MSIKIGIIEDDLLTAQNIYQTLGSVGYLPFQPVHTYADAIKMIETSSPDFLIIDISLGGISDGVNLATVINTRFNIPFIFLTGKCDATTLARAKVVNPYAYIVKPFNQQDLYITIEVALENFNKQKTKVENSSLANTELGKFVFIKEGGLFHKIDKQDILYVKSDHKYLAIITNQRQFLISSKLDDFINVTGNEKFVRVHRRYAVNAQHINTISNLSVLVGNKEVPLNQNYKKELLSKVNLLK